MKMLIFVVLFQILLNTISVHSLNTGYGDGVYSRVNNNARNYGNYPEISGYSKSFRRSRTSKDFNFTPNHNINNQEHKEKTEDDASNYLRNFKPFLDDSDTDKLTEQQKLLLRNIADHLAQYEPEIIQEHQRKSLNLNNENANEGRARTKKNNNSTRRKAKRPVTSIVIVQDSTTPSTTSTASKTTTTASATKTTRQSTVTSQSPATKTTANQPVTTLKASTKSATKSTTKTTATRQNAKVVAKNSITTTNKPNTTRLPSNVTTKDVGRGDTSSKLKPDQQPAESKVRH